MISKVAVLNMKENEYNNNSLNVSKDDVLNFYLIHLLSRLDNEKTFYFKFVY